MSKRKLKRFAGILVKYDDKVLLCKRSPDNSLPNVWSVPGGGIEPGEKPKETAIREFYEETNIEIKNDDDINLIGVINNYTKDGDIKGVMYIYLYKSDIMLKPNLDLAQDGHEHSECGYFTIKELPFDDYTDQLFKLILKTI